MKTYKVSELEGALLDMAVADALGLNPVLIDGKAMIPAHEEEDYPGEMLPWPASTDWSYGGPIIERERISLKGDKDGGWYAYFDHLDATASGNSPLVAAMRAFVASKFGETVDLDA